MAKRGENSYGSFTDQKSQGFGSGREFDPDNPYGIDYSKVDQNAIQSEGNYTGSNYSYPDSGYSSSYNDNFYQDPAYSGQQYKNDEFSSQYNTQDAYGYNMTSSNSSFDPNSPYSGNTIDQNVSQNHQFQNNAYGDVQKQVEAKGKPVHVGELDPRQRAIMKRRIINVYPDLLSPNELQQLMLYRNLSNLCGIGTTFGIPLSLILMHRARQETPSSMAQMRYVNRSIVLQVSCVFAIYFSNKYHTDILNKFSNKYLKDLDDESIINFEKVYPTIKKNRAMYTEK